MRLSTLAALALPLGAMLLAGSARADYTNEHRIAASARMQLVSTQGNTTLQDFSLSDISAFYGPDPQAGGSASAQLQRTLDTLEAGNVWARVEPGTLRAFSSIRHVDDGGLFPNVVSSHVSADATASLVDTIAVTGAGLPDGTPVRYTLPFHVSGSVVPPAGSGSGLVYANASAFVELRDVNNAQSSQFSWLSGRDGVGDYQLVLDTFVGHYLRLRADLDVIAGGAGPTGGLAEADFSRTALLWLTPSVAGLNTLGASGHDYALSAVPEPGSWALWLAGGLALPVLARRRGHRS